MSIGVYAKMNEEILAAFTCKTTIDRTFIC
jgi:hypothetical protein